MKTLRDVNSPFDTRPDCMSHDKPAMADDDSFLDGHRDEEEEKMVYARKRNKCEASVWAGFCIFAITSTSPDWWWLLPAFIAFTVLRVSSDVEPWWLCGAESLKHLEYFAPDFDLN